MDGEREQHRLFAFVWDVVIGFVEDGSVRLVLRRYADGVELRLVDDGPGVPGAIQGQLFEPFFTTEAKGTGLGLYLARELCAANRATLEYVDDAPGAHFRIVWREARAA